MNHVATDDDELFANLSGMDAADAEIPGEDELITNGSIDDAFDLDVELADGRLA